MEHRVKGRCIRQCHHTIVHLLLLQRSVPQHFWIIHYVRWCVGSSSNKLIRSAFLHHPPFWSMSGQKFVALQLRCHNVVSLAWPQNLPHLNAPPWVCVLMSPSSHILQVFITTNFVAESDMQAAHLCLHFHLVKNYEYDLKNSYAKISSRITWWTMAPEVPWRQQAGSQYSDFHSPHLVST